MFCQTKEIPSEFTLWWQPLAPLFRLLSSSSFLQESETPLIAGFFGWYCEEIEALVINGGLLKPFELVFRVAPEPCEVLFCFKLSVLLPADGMLLPSVLVIPYFCSSSSYSRLAFFLCYSSANSICCIFFIIFLFSSFCFYKSSSSCLILAFISYLSLSLEDFYPSKI